MRVTVLALLLAYLLGSIPAGAWVARLGGIDIRTVGSGNPGATNVLRALGWGPALLVAAFDIFKGVLAVLLARLVLDDAFVEALCGALAVLGHNFSVFLGFKGGKGVATSFGTLLIIDPLLGAGAFCIGLFCIVTTRLVSAGSMVGAVSALVIALVLSRAAWEIGVVGFLAALLVWQHRDNIKRLQSGVERRLGEKAAK
nr:glycerol-3-phosphate 1-O-acyltransferase PlsY [Deinococcus yavapaiensis]